MCSQLLKAWSWAGSGAPAFVAPALQRRPRSWPEAGLHPAAGWSQPDTKEGEEEEEEEEKEEAGYGDYPMYFWWAPALILLGLFRDPLAELRAQLLGSGGSPDPDPGARSSAAAAMLLRVAALLACCGNWWARLAGDFVKQWPKYSRFLGSVPSPVQVLLSAWDTDEDAPPWVSRCGPPSLPPSALCPPCSCTFSVGASCSRPPFWCSL